MRRQTTDFFDKDKLTGKDHPKIYTWDTPDKESTNNYQAFDVGMMGIGFRFNVNQQTRAVIKFRTLNDVISSVGGYKASIAGIFAVIYGLFFADLIKLSLLNKIKDRMKNENDSMGGPEIDEVRDKLGVSQVKADKVDFKGIKGVIDFHGDPENVMKQIINFKDMAEIVAKMSS
jgi:hypothetical protein